MTRTAFGSLAWLYAPADEPEACALVEAGEDWQLRLPAGQPAAVWGRLPARHSSPARLLRSALAREMALREARAGAAELRMWDRERLPPVSRRPGWRGSLRSGLRSGGVVRFGAGSPQPRVADRVAEGAGHRGPRVRLTASGDGSALARLIRPHEPPALLRLATVGGLKDAGRNSGALGALGAAGVGHVPPLIAAGTNLGVGWSVEGELPGELVRRATRELLAEVVAWSSSLPLNDDAGLALEERLELISRSFPQAAADLRPALEMARERARDVPGVVEHGDLWTGNLLAVDGHLTGVVDWDNWHPSGVPGSDLLHLVAMARRSRTGLEVGELWLERPWAEAAFHDLTAAYWSHLGLRPTADVTWLAGVSWWAAHVTAGLRRGRQPSDDPRWVARNVENVAPRLAASR